MAGGSIIADGKFVFHLDGAGELQVGDVIQFTDALKETVTFRVVSRVFSAYRDHDGMVRGWEINVVHSP